MKILTLLEIIQTQVDTKKYSGRLKRRSVDGFDDELEMKGKELNHGAYSKVKRGRDPHTVIKSSITPLNDKEAHALNSDGYQTYAEAVIKYKLYDNPHFPRIYSYRRIEDSTGNHINKFEIEALVDYESLTPEELNSVIDANFNLDIDPEEDVDIVDALNGCVQHGTCKFIKSESLVKACKMLGLLYKRHIKPNQRKLYYDIREANIMFRRGPGGLTLVFTDPFS